VDAEGAVGTYDSVMLKLTRVVLAVVLLLAVCVGISGQAVAGQAGAGRAVAAGAAQVEPSAEAGKTAAAKAGAGRVSPNVAIITIAGAIDSTTAASVERRLKAAEKAGADAVVLEINTPGGEVGAVLRICGLLKKTTVPRTVAWVNDQAYSGGAIIALACQEIVTAGGSRFGDAAPIRFSPIFGLQSLGDSERAKALAPLVVEMVDSARRHGYDEKLVQGFIALGVELWLIENTATGERLFVDRAEYLRVFGQEPSEGVLPRVASMADAPKRRLAPMGVESGGGGSGGGVAGPDAGTELKPAIPFAGRDLRQVNDALALKGTLAKRPVLTAKDRGQWTLIEYATDGRTILTLGDGEMLAWRMSRGTVNNDEELKAYFSAAKVGRLDMVWYEQLARVLDDPMVRGILIVVMLLGLFVELVHPGLIFPGAVAGVALVGVLLPGLLIGLGVWWALVAIVSGILLLMLEAFVLPGFGLFGVVGLLLLFGGLVMTFLPSEDLPFMDPSERWRGLGFGLVSVVVGTVTAGATVYYLSKHLRMIPVFGKLVLDSSGTPDVATVGVSASEAGLAGAAGAVVAIGAEGLAITALRPSGKVEIDGQIVDVVVDGGFVAPGERVRVIALEGMRTVVERV